MNILRQKKEAVSMTTLYTMYDIGLIGSRYRSRLKTRIKNQFREDAIFAQSVVIHLTLLLPRRCHYLK